MSGRSELSDILRIGLTDADAFNSFKAVMDDETKDRFWVETNLSTGIQTSGDVFGGQLNIFLAGLKNLIALATKGNFNFSQ